MRFISPIGAYRIVAIHDKVVPDSSGYMRTTEPGYTVEFKQGLLNAFERELVREKLQFPGGVTDRRNVDNSPYDVVGMASVFDSEWIEDEKLREKVEQFMLKNPGCGSPTDYVLVERPKLPTPWESYDRLTVHGQRKAEHVAARNLEIAEATGVSVEALIAYERENRNDGKIIAAYEAVKTESTEPAEELIQA